MLDDFARLIVNDKVQHDNIVNDEVEHDDKGIRTIQLDIHVALFLGAQIYLFVLIIVCIVGALVDDGDNDELIDLEEEDSQDCFCVIR